MGKETRNGCERGLESEANGKVPALVLKSDNAAQIEGRADQHETSKDVLLRVNLWVMLTIDLMGIEQ